MAKFSVNAQRFDPYKNFKFRVKWDGRYVAGVSKVGALKRTTEVVEHREGCWVSEYTAMPELDASANAVAIQSMTLQNEGWERDYDVTEPTEPSFVEPQG